MNELDFINGGGETGFDPFGTIVDAAAGGPQKRRRTREAQAQAAAAIAEAQALTREAAGLVKIQQPLPATYRAPAPVEPVGLVARWRGALAAPSPFGVPWWMVAAGAAVGAWAIAPGKLSIPAGLVAGGGVAVYASALAENGEAA